jgi:uncharacterized protein
MLKLELEIIALSHAITQSHSYTVVLGEVDGNRRLPIVIGSAEAQAIAVALEKVKPSRPLTHDLIRNLFTAFEADLQEVVISDFNEGIFYCKLICTTANDTLEIDSRTSDGIALAVRFGCPIYTYDKILEQAGLKIESHGALKSNYLEQDDNTAETTTANDLNGLTLVELNKLLEEVLEQEDYIKAIAIRDEIKNREK